MTSKDNSRVTIAVLSTKIDNLSRRIDEFLDELRNHEDRIVTLEKQQSALEAKVNIWSGLNSLGTIIASLLGLQK